jgi:hypothetical protein
MNYFELVPNEVLEIIFSFVDSIRDSFELLQTCKRFYTLIKPNEVRWKSLCLNLWESFICKVEAHIDDKSTPIWYSLIYIQRVLCRDWVWISKCFLVGRVCNHMSLSATIGLKDGNGYGAQICESFISAGNFHNSVLEGPGTSTDEESTYVGSFIQDARDIGVLTYRSEPAVEYRGQWINGFLHGPGSIVYPDGVVRQGVWEKNGVFFDAQVSDDRTTDYCYVQRVHSYFKRNK